jgi:uncharacterized protein with ACT and thioredoxin-like domain
MLVVVLVFALLFEIKHEFDHVTTRAVHREHLTVYRHRVISHGGGHGVTAVFDGASRW